MTVIREQFHTNVDESTKTEAVHDLDDDGNLFVTLDIEKNESSFSIKVFIHRILVFRGISNANGLNDSIPDNLWRSGA